MRPFKFLILIFILSLFGISGINIIHPGVGEEAPEIILNNPEGEQIKLSSLRGKLVLIDFWASWCRTCRVENRTFAKTYERFKASSFSDGKGFEIFSVSLDVNQDQWRRAIENDKLSWSSHGCDFQKWDSPIVDSYNFKYLPHNVLIDKEGKVIAKELYGSRLTEFLESRLSE